MATPNYYVVFEGNEPEIYSSWTEARKNNNIQDQYYRTFPTWPEAFVAFSVYKEPSQVRLLRAALYGAPTHGYRTRPDGRQRNCTEQAIEDAVTIGAYLVANPVVDEEDGYDVEVSVDGCNLPNDGHSAEFVAAGPSNLHPNLESGNDDQEITILKKDQPMLDEKVEE